MADLEGASVKMRDSRDEKRSSFQLPGEVPHILPLQASAPQPPFHHASAEMFQHYWNIFGEGSLFHSTQCPDTRDTSFTVPT